MYIDSEVKNSNLFKDKTLVARPHQKRNLKLIGILYGINPDCEWITGEIIRFEMYDNLRIKITSMKEGGQEYLEPDGYKMEQRGEFVEFDAHYFTDIFDQTFSFHSLSKLNLNSESISVFNIIFEV